MSDEIEIDGVQYVSSKRASELSGYTQDYIGQLARGGYIDAKRIGGLWHVSMTSLQTYEKDAAIRKSQIAQDGKRSDDPDSLISFDGKDYVSAARAAQITGYHQDYVGQLAREGSIISRQVGNRWYVSRESILAHKEEKDRLLGAVQAQSVGIPRNLPKHISQPNMPEIIMPDEYLTYTKDTADLIALNSDDAEISPEIKEGEDYPQDQPIPIRVNRTPSEALEYSQNDKKVSISDVKKIPRKTIFYVGTAAAVLIVFIGISLSLLKTSGGSDYADKDTNTLTRNAFVAGAASMFKPIGDILENLLVPDLIYKRLN